MAEPYTLKGGSTPRETGLAEELGRFRSSSIQRNYTYFVEFLDSDLNELVKPHQVLGINLPFPIFQKQVIGGMFFPLGYAEQKGDGYEVRLVLLETGLGNVRTLIDTLASKIRKPNGLYYAPVDQKILGVKLKILDTAGRIADSYEYNGMMYLSAEEINFTYEGNEAVRMNITFHVDEINRKGTELE